MKERDCANCKHHTEDGCSSWDCEFEAKDLISRADAIACLSHGEGCGHSCRNRINALPSADAEQRWIPCSERLPSESGWYLITVYGYEHIVDMSWWYGEQFVWNGVQHWQEVVAWMPLPKPYREKSEVEE